MVMNNRCQVLLCLNYNLKVKVKKIMVSREDWVIIIIKVGDYLKRKILITITSVDIRATKMKIEQSFTRNIARMVQLLDSQENAVIIIKFVLVAVIVQKY